MKAFEKIFTINKEGVLELNKPEIRSIAPFREVLARDKGQHTEKGDYDGRKKYFAFKELLYIHLFASHISIYRDLPDEAKAENCKRDAELPDNWKPDKLIIKACKAYNKIENLSALFHAFINTSKGLYSIGEDVKFFNEQKERIRKSIKDKTALLVTTILEEEVQKLEQSINLNTTQLMDLNTKILNITNSLPPAYSTLEDLHKKLIDEAQNGAAVYGGGKVNAREK